MATNSQNSLQVSYSDPLYLYVHSGIDNSGNDNFGGYNLYVVKVPPFEVPDLSTSGLLFTRKLEHVKTIYPEIDVSYSGRINKIGDYPIRRLTYSPSYIYPVEYYDVEENKDHYFYLTAFDKDGNVSSGFISHSNNPFRGPSIQSRAIQFSNAQSTVTLYNSGILFPIDTGGAYPSGTISFWMTTPSSENPAASNDYGIFDKVNSNNRPAPVGIHVESTAGGHPFIRFLIGVGGSSSGGVGTSYEYWETSTLEYNKNYHVVCVWSGVNATTIKATVYLNGVSDVSSNKTISAGMPNGPTGGSNPSIGYVSGRLDSWSGLILDGMHIYNIPLDSTQVSELYSGQVHGIPWSYLPDNLITKFSFDEGSGIVTYADYPVLTPEISGAFSGDVRWVKPLYRELQQTSLSSDIIQFFDGYVTSGIFNSGVIEPDNVTFQDRIFTSDLTKTIAETFQHPSQLLGQNLIPARYSLYNNDTPWAYSGFYSVSYTETVSNLGLLGFVPQYGIKGTGQPVNSGYIAFDVNMIQDGNANNYSVTAVSNTYFVYPSVYIKAGSSSLLGDLDIYLLTNGGAKYTLYSGTLTLSQAWTKYSIPSGIDGNVLGTFYGKLIVHFISNHPIGGLTKYFYVDAPSVYLAPSGVYLDTPPWSMGTKLSGLISAPYLSPTAISRIFTTSGVQAQVEALNNNGVIANNKVVDASIEDGTISNTKFSDSEILSQSGGALKNRTGSVVTLNGDSVIDAATIGDTLFTNQSILYSYDTDTLKQLDGTTKKLKYTSISGVQEYRQAWSSTSVKLSGGATTTYYATTATGIIAEIPIRIQSADTLVYVTGFMRTSVAGVAANLWIESCDDTCNAPQFIASTTSTSWTAVSGYAEFTSLTPGPGAIQLSLGPNGAATASGYYFSVEIGDHF